MSGLRPESNWHAGTNSCASELSYTIYSSRVLTVASLVVSILWIVLAMLAVVAHRDKMDTSVRIVMATMFTFSALRILFTRISLTETGIELRKLWRTRQISYSDIDRVEFIPGGLAGLSECVSVNGLHVTIVGSTKQVVGVEKLMRDRIPAAR